MSAQDTAEPMTLQDVIDAPDQAVKIIAAADNVCRILRGLIGMSDEHYSCVEAEAFAGLLTQMGYHEDADDFIRWHAEGDDGGDDHWHLNPDYDPEEEVDN